MTKLQQEKGKELAEKYSAKGFTVKNTSYDNTMVSLDVTGIDNEHPELGEQKIYIVVRYHSFNVNRVIDQGNWESIELGKF
jgi:hypothetical protein